MKKTLIILVVIETILLIAISIFTFTRKPEVKTVEKIVEKVVYVEKESEGGTTQKPDENPPKVDEPVIFADEAGNTYELIKYVTGAEGKQLVIFQNTKTKTISMALLDYFNEKYHKVNG